MPIHLLKKGIRIMWIIDDNSNIKELFLIDLNGKYYIDGDGIRYALHDKYTVWRLDNDLCVNGVFTPYEAIEHLYKALE